MLAFAMYFLIFSVLFSVLVASAQCDLPEPWQLVFQDPASPMMEGIVNLHNDVMTILLFVLSLVTIIMGAAIYLLATTRYIPAATYTGLTHNTNLEFVRTLIPCVILLLIALPSFSLIYALDNQDILTLMLPGGWVVRPLGWTRGGGLYQTTKHPLYFSPGKPFGNELRG